MEVREGCGHNVNWKALASTGVCMYSIVLCTCVAVKCWAAKSLQKRGGNV